MANYSQLTGLVLEALKALTFPSSCIGNSQVQAGAGIAASKLQHQHKKTFAQVGTAAAVAGQVLHVATGATGTITALEIGSIAACIGDATITVDMKKNGTSCLNAAIAKWVFPDPVGPDSKVLLSVDSLSAVFIFSPPEKLSKEHPINFFGTS